MSPLSSLKQLINSSDKTLTHSAPAWFFWLDQSLCCMQPIEYRTYIYAPGPADSHIWGVIIRPRCTPTLLFSYKLPNLSTRQNGIQNLTGIPTLTSLSIFCIWNSLPTSDFGISSCNLSAASRTWTGRPKQTHKYNQSVWCKTPRIVFHSNYVSNCKRKVIPHIADSCTLCHHMVTSVSYFNFRLSDIPLNWALPHDFFSNKRSLCGQCHQFYLRHISEQPLRWRGCVNPVLRYFTMHLNANTKPNHSKFTAHAESQNILWKNAICQIISRHDESMKHSKKVT